MSTINQGTSGNTRGRIKLLARVLCGVLWYTVVPLIPLTSMPQLAKLGLEELNL